MKKQNTGFLLTFTFLLCASVPLCLIAFVAENLSIKNNKLCKTNPISEKPKMNLNHYKTKHYDNKSGLLTMEKQTQTKPTCSELVESILSAFSSVEISLSLTVYGLSEMNYNRAIVIFEKGKRNEKNTDCFIS
jgi:hypothetical protein